MHTSAGIIPGGEELQQTMAPLCVPGTFTAVLDSISSSDLHGYTLYRYAMHAIHKHNTYCCSTWYLILRIKRNSSGNNSSSRTDSISYSLQ